MSLSNLTWKETVGAVVVLGLLNVGAYFWFYSGTPVARAHYSVPTGGITVQAPAYPVIKQPDHAAERAKFLSVRKELVAKKPKTGSALKAILGEPSQITQGVGAPDSEMWIWIYQSEPLKNDVVNCIVDANGKVTILNY